MQIQGNSLSIDLLMEMVRHQKEPLTLSPEAKALMWESRSYIEKRINQGEVIYGVNTGFGAFSSVRISNHEIETLQRNLIRSHSAGIGEPFTPQQTKAMMILRANALATGKSGIRPLVVEKILEFINNDIIPVIPCKGSVGASGDLAPLSHLALALIGEGEVWTKDQRKVSVDKVLVEKNIQPLVLQAKEGLSLINGCQVMTAIGMLTAYDTRNLLKVIDVSGAMSLEALRGSRSAFDPLISATRNHPGEGKTARNLMKILSQKSEIADSHFNCSKVQDAYSLRCMPAVHGAVKDTLRQVISTLEIEANSSTDNPLVFANENKILSCGNFHGMPVAFAMDYLGIALSSLASISECRIAKLINPAMSDLPAFLVQEGGLQSGHMIVQVAAASLVSENKILSHPASVDTIPTSAEKEDHVSMGTIAARKAGSILENAQTVVAMELLSSTQGIDLLAPLQPSKPLQVIKNFIREQVPYAKEDRVFSKDIHCLLNLIKSEVIVKTIEAEVGELEV
ncbi:MAG: histidine ammonia-lyase [Deltaproteobacteria bacterium]|jgi:histidine ammonia-lyase|nr:histidine ammonia-lyase [Deltaproteobacteria bacterium]